MVNTDDAITNNGGLLCGTTAALPNHLAAGGRAPIAAGTEAAAAAAAPYPAAMAAAAAAIGFGCWAAASCSCTQFTLPPATFATITLPTCVSFVLAPSILCPAGRATRCVLVSAVPVAPVLREELVNASDNGREVVAAADAIDGGTCCFVWRSCCCCFADCVGIATVAEAVTGAFDPNSVPVGSVALGATATERCDGPVPTLAPALIEGGTNIGSETDDGSTSCCFSSSSTAAGDGDTRPWFRRPTPDDSDSSEMPEDSGQLRTTTTSDDSGPLRTTLEDSGQPQTTPDNSYPDDYDSERLRTTLTPLTTISDDSYPDDYDYGRLRTTPDDSGQLRRLRTTPDDSRRLRLRTTLADSGRLWMTSDDYGRLQTTLDDSV
uniref:Uncharacterized protein n=1 Tax=Anopheles melas TaxID=34690 RepID=A0A182TUA2_9DIPT